MPDYMERRREMKLILFDCHFCTQHCLVFDIQVRTYTGGRGGGGGS